MCHRFDRTERQCRHANAICLLSRSRRRANVSSSGIGRVLMFKAAIGRPIWSFKAAKVKGNSRAATRSAISCECAQQN
jgi:hypothetical protein